MNAEQKQGRNEIKFLGSLTLLVLALGAFVALLYYFAPENKPPLEQTLAYDDEQELLQKRTRPLRTSPNDDEQIEATSDPAAQQEVAAATEDKTTDEQQNKDSKEAIDKAVALVDGGNPDEALAILLQVLSKDPTNERALVEVAMIHLIDYRDTDASVPFLERTLQVNASNRLVLAELVAIYGEQGNVEGGLSFLRGLQQKAAPKDKSFISLGIGQMLISDGRVDEGVAHVERAAEGLPNNANILTSLAGTYARGGNSDKAVATYRKAIAVREAEINKLPTNDKKRRRKRQILLLTRFEIVKEFYRRGEFDAALEELETISKQAPNSPLVSNWRKRIAQRAG